MIRTRKFKFLSHDHQYSNSKYFNCTTPTATATTTASTTTIGTTTTTTAARTAHSTPDFHLKNTGIHHRPSPNKRYYGIITTPCGVWEIRTNRWGLFYIILSLFVVLISVSTKTATSYGFRPTVVTWNRPQHRPHRTNCFDSCHTLPWMWGRSHRPTATIATFRRKRYVRPVVVAAAMQSISTDMSSNGTNDDYNNKKSDYNPPNNFEDGNIRSTTGTTGSAHWNNNRYSLANLQRRVAVFVERQPSQPTLHKLCLAIAGGGGHLLSTLAATPGASSILLEGTIPYSREAFRQYIQPSNTSSNENNEDTFKYCSEVAAQRLASAAYHRALHLVTTNAVAAQTTTATTNWTNVLRSPMGVASTSVLQSTIYTTRTGDGRPVRTTRRSVESFGSRAFCAIQTSSGLQIQIHVQLAKAAAPTTVATTDSAASENDRSRLDEDVLVSHYLLSAIELYHYAKNNDDVVEILGIDPQEASFCVSSTSDNLILRGTTFQGDAVMVTLPPSFLARKTSNMDDDIEPTTTTTTTAMMMMSVDDPLRNAAERVLSGQDEVVMILLPQGDHDHSNTSAGNDGSSRGGTIEVMGTTMLPPHSLVVPGSFNPIHVGHIALAQAAAQAMAQPCNAIWFELSITNVDKPALAIDTIIERIKYFFPLRHEIPSDMCWGILLTNAPLFKQKVDLLAPLQFNSPDSTLHFSIGTDTLVRLIDPKYYNNSEEEMLRTLMDMSCHFVVGGRLDQKKPSSEDGGEISFIAGDEVIETLPSAIHDKFTILPGFRIDLSSTEIRQKMEAEKQPNPSP